MPTLEQNELDAEEQKLTARKSELEEWLDRNFDRIEKKRQNGIDVSAAEKVWLDRLHEYESVCDKLRSLLTF